MNTHQKMQKVARGQTEKKIRVNHAARSGPDMKVQTVTAAIVHEVNQPLAAALIDAEAALQWLRREPPNLGKAELAIERLIGNSLRIANATKSVRDLVQESSLQISDVNINNSIKNILSLHQFDLRRRNIKIELDLADPAPAVKGDRIQLERLIANLITNSVDAMCSVDSRKRILWVNTKPYRNDSTILVEVMDTGIGIDPIIRDRLFQPFSTTKQHGMGLGLWLCRAIAERHGGKLWAEPNTPYGSILRFTLPLFTQLIAFKAQKSRA